MVPLVGEQLTRQHHRHFRHTGCFDRMMKSLFRADTAQSQYKVLLRYSDRQQIKWHTIFDNVAGQRRGHYTLALGNEVEMNIPPSQLS
jgi:hypothetical protein